MCYIWSCYHHKLCADNSRYFYYYFLARAWVLAEAEASQVRIKYFQSNTG